MSRNIAPKQGGVNHYKPTPYRDFTKSQPQEMNACDWDFLFEKNATSPCSK